MSKAKKAKVVNKKLLTGTIALSSTLVAGALSTNISHVHADSINRDSSIQKLQLANKTNKVVLRSSVMGPGPVIPSKSTPNKVVMGPGPVIPNKTMPAYKHGKVVMGPGSVIPNKTMPAYKHAASSAASQTSQAASNAAGVTPLTAGTTATRASLPQTREEYRASLPQTGDNVEKQGILGTLMMAVSSFLGSIGLATKKH